MRSGEAWMYLLMCDDASAVKIGYATRVDDRLTDLQVGCPLELRLLAHTLTMDPLGDERALHRHFDPHLLRGEWYRAQPVLEALLPVFREHRLREFIAALSPTRARGHRQLSMSTHTKNFAWAQKYRDARRARLAAKKARAT